MDPLRQIQQRKNNRRKARSPKAKPRDSRFLAGQTEAPVTGDVVPVVVPVVAPVVAPATIAPKKLRETKKVTAPSRTSRFLIGDGSTTMEAALPIKLHEAEPTPTAKGTPDSKVIVGFWMIPKGGEQYMKLGIHSTYTFTEDQVMPNISVAWRELMKGEYRKSIKGALGDSDWTVNIEMGGQLLPVWAIIANIDLLGPHFRWLPAMMKNPSLNNIYLPSMGQETVSAAVEIQNQLMRRGWSFAVKDGTNIQFGHHGGSWSRPPYFTTMLVELSGREKMSPQSIEIAKKGEIKTIQDFDSSGSASSLRRPLSSLMSRSSPDQKRLDSDEDQPNASNDLKEYKARLEDPDKERNFAAWINNNINKKLKLIEFVPEYNGHSWWDPAKQPFDKVDQKIIRHYFDYDRFIGAVKGSPKDEMTSLAAVIGALADSKHRQLMTDIGWDDMAFHKFSSLLHGTEEKESEKSEIGESSQSHKKQKHHLNEMTFRELLRQTRNSGGYRVGGMRRIHGRWLYDVSVPDRISNSRFVIVRQPTLGLDEDSSPIYRFRFRSRADRNTTGTAQSGYVKFKQTKRNILKRAIRYISSTEMDEDVQVACGCPDFRFMWHWVLAKAGASHQPTGIGFDATDDPPNKTNPRHRIGLCKHLCVFQSILSKSARDHDKNVKVLQKPKDTIPSKDGEPPTIKPGTDLDKTKSSTISPSKETIRPNPDAPKPGAPVLIKPDKVEPKSIWDKFKKILPSRHESTSLTETSDANSIQSLKQKIERLTLVSNEATEEHSRLFNADQGHHYSSFDNPTVIAALNLRNQVYSDLSKAKKQLEKAERAERVLARANKVKLKRIAEPTAPAIPAPPIVESSSPPSPHTPIADSPPHIAPSIVDYSPPHTPLIVDSPPHTPDPAHIIPIADSPPHIAPSIVESEIEIPESRAKSKAKQLLTTSMLQALLTKASKASIGSINVTMKAQTVSGQNVEITQTAEEALRKLTKDQAGLSAALNCLT